MARPGFIAATSATLLRATPTKIAIDTLTERTANLSWPGPSRHPYTVLYSPTGAQFLSRRHVIHPRVKLNNLTPGQSYTVQVIDDDAQASTTFTTTATATTDEAPSDVQAPLTELSRLEIRVGKIIECAPHPDADTLYVEQVDVGEDEPRTIVSGLVNFVQLEEMVGRRVVVLCNLKPRTMRGVTSKGMLLCASNEDHSIVDPLAPPESANVGDIVTFEGHRVAPIEPGNRATKAFDRVVADLRTKEDGQAFYQDVPFSVGGGVCVSPKGLVGAIS